MAACSFCFILRGFADAAGLAAERKRALFSANPFGAAEVLNGLEMDSYAPFPYLPPVKPGKFGKVCDALCRSARQ